MLVFLKRLLVILDSILGGPWTHAFEGRSLTCKADNIQADILISSYPG